MHPVSTKKLRFLPATLPGTNRLPMYVTACRRTTNWHRRWDPWWTAANRVRAEVHLFPSPGRQVLHSGCGWHIHWGVLRLRVRRSLITVCLLLPLT